MQIRPIKENEIKEASLIVGKNYSLAYAHSSAIEIKAMFENQVIPPKYLVAEEKGKIIGLAGYIQSWMDYHIYNIFWVNVEPKNQGKGIGTKLVQTTINRIKSIKGKNKKAHLILLTTTKPNFYKKLGFRKLTKLRKNNEFLMALDLINE